MPSHTSRKVIYAATPHQNWITAAEMLEEESGLVPVYWECPAKLKPKIEESFSEVTVHNALNAPMGVPPEDSNLESPFDFPIDSEKIKDYAETKDLALKMMDRIDPGNVVRKESLGYNERVRHYNRLLSYWIKQIDQLNPDIVIFGSSPHLINDFVLYTVAKEQNIETIIFRHTSLPETFYLTESIDEGPNLPQKIDSTNSEIPQDIKSYLSRLKMDYSSGEPSYMRETDTGVGLMSVVDTLKTHFIPSSKDRFKELIFNKNILRWTVSANIKYGSDKIENSAEINWIKWLYFLVKSRYYLRNLKESYNTKTSPPSFSEEYIYFPLHYQPERTTSPEGGHYVDQTIVANMLSKVASDQLVYIKEHPSQFDPQLKGQLGRRKWQYDDLLTHKNIRLVPVGTDPYELIDNAVAVATVTGTAGWEAINRATPAITFGSAWYRDAPGVYKIDTYSDLKESMESIRGLNTWNRKDIEEYVQKIISASYQGKINEATTPKANQAETIFTAINNRISN